jgi:hypothetical protein
MVALCCVASTSTHKYNHNKIYNKEFEINGNNINVFVFINVAIMSTHYTNTSLKVLQYL